MGAADGPARTKHWVLADARCPSGLREAEPAAPHRPPSPDPAAGLGTAERGGFCCSSQARGKNPKAQTSSPGTAETGRATASVPRSVSPSLKAPVGLGKHHKQCCRGRPDRARRRGESLWGVKGAGVGETTGKRLGNALKPPKTLIRDTPVKMPGDNPRGRSSWRAEQEAKISLAM